MDIWIEFPEMEEKQVVLKFSFFSSKLFKCQKNLQPTVQNQKFSDKSFIKYWWSILGIVIQNEVIQLGQMLITLKAD